MAAELIAFVRARLDHMTTPARFRWRFADDVVGEDVTGWHVDAASCPECCCRRGPTDGEHWAPAGYYDGGGRIDWSAHTYCDPHEDGDQVEWQASRETMGG